MKKIKVKETYYSFTCPVCNKQIGVGNWKEKLEADYFNHYYKEHYPEPIVKSEKR